MELREFFIVAAGVTAGLHAGLLYDFSVDIVPAMRKLKPRAHIEMFHTIDKTITNPVFFISFFGPLILTPLAAWQYSGEPQFTWLVAAFLVQLILCNGVTVSKHLPLNSELALVDTGKISDEEAEKIRQDFQGQGSKWVRWHTVRTLAGTAATTLLFAAAII